MMRRFVLLAAVIAALAPSITGCGPSDDEAGSVSLAPVEIADQAGAVCGMLVRDQSAPRAQVIHADGERSFLCSIGDLLVYLDAPSPHGDPLEVLVEVMEPDEVADGVMGILDSAETGQCFVQLRGGRPTAFEFPPVPGR